MIYPETHNSQGMDLTEHPTMVEQIVEIWNFCIIRYYSAIKRDGILWYREIGMSLEDIMLGE